MKKPRKVRDGLRRWFNRRAGMNLSPEGWFEELKLLIEHKEKIAWLRGYDKAAIIGLTNAIESAKRFELAEERKAFVELLKRKKGERGKKP